MFGHTAVNSVKAGDKMCQACALTFRRFAERPHSTIVGSTTVQPVLVLAPTTPKRRRLLKRLISTTSDVAADFTTTLPPQWAALHFFFAHLVLPRGGYGAARALAWETKSSLALSVQTR